MIELAGMMILANGTMKPRPSYLDTPQSQWTKEQIEEAVRDQQAVRAGLSSVQKPHTGGASD